MITADNTVNFRPVGGGDAALGGIYRTGTLCRLNAAAANALRETMAVRAFIDLRSHSELSRQGRPESLTAAGIAWIHTPIEGYDHHAIATLQPSPVDYARYYQSMLERAGHAIVRALDRIAAARGPLAFGCYAGKDRTGIVAAALLELAGRSRDDIRADYAQSTEYMRKSAHFFQANWQKRDLSREAYLDRVRAHPETIDILYCYIDKQGGSLIDTLRTHQLAEATIRTLKARFAAHS